jgi:hypothetical protein
MTIRPEVTRFGTFALLLVHILNLWDVTSSLHHQSARCQLRKDTKLDAAVIYNDITSWTMSYYVVFICDVSRYLNYTSHFVRKENVSTKHYICRSNAAVFK